MYIRRVISSLVLLTTMFFHSSGFAEEPLKFGYNQWIGSSGLFIAIKEDYFAKHGVAVEFTEFPGPGDGIPALIAGQLDGVATTCDNVILMADKAGADKMKQVYFSDTSAGGDGIVAKDGISSVEDLKGKTVAASIGQVSHLLLNNAMQKYGLSDDDIKLVNMDGEAAGAAYMAGKVDAAVTWEPWLSNGKSTGGKVIYSSADAPNLILDSIAFNSKFAEKHPEKVKAFLKAIDEGDSLIREKPEEAYKILSDFLDISEADIKGMLGGVKFYSKDMNKTLFETNGFLDASQDVKKFLLDRELITKDFDISPLFDGSYL